MAVPALKLEPMVLFVDSSELAMEWFFNWPPSVRLPVLDVVLNAPYVKKVCNQWCQLILVFRLCVSFRPLSKRCADSTCVWRAGRACLKLQAFVIEGSRRLCYGSGIMRLERVQELPAPCHHAIYVVYFWVPYSWIGDGGIQQCAAKILCCLLLDKAAWSFLPSDVTHWLASV